jgi:hypothetical protein
VSGSAALLQHLGDRFCFQSASGNQFSKGMGAPSHVFRLACGPIQFYRRHFFADLRLTGSG